MNVNAFTQALTGTPQAKQSGHRSDVSPTIRLTGPDHDTLQFGSGVNPSAVEVVEEVIPQSGNIFRRFTEAPELSTSTEKVPSGFLSSLARNIRKFLSNFSVKQYDMKYGESFRDGLKYTNSGN